MTDFWTAFTATWPIWVFVAAMTAYAMWACRASAGDHDYPPRDAAGDGAEPDLTWPMLPPEMVANLRAAIDRELLIDRLADMPPRATTYEIEKDRP